MLGDKDATVTIAVGDLERAKEFYGGTLGLTQEKEDKGGVLYKSGNTKLYVYPSAYAGTNQATYVTWHVDDVETAVNELSAKGVTFEHYDDLPETTRDGDVHTMGGTAKGAWFKDPDGNILAIGDM